MPREGFGFYKVQDVLQLEKKKADLLIFVLKHNRLIKQESVFYFKEH